jgi:hypothetical protein
MMSKSSAVGYFGRLGALLAFGVTCNIIGFAVANWLYQSESVQWWLDLGNVVYQMWYVVFLALFALIAWPLRAVLRGDKDGTVDPNTALISLALYGSFWLGSSGVYLAGVQISAGDVGDSSWGAHIEPIFESLTWIMSHVSGFLALTALHAYLGRATDGRLPWLLFAYVYLPRILIPMSFALAPMMIFFFLLGVVVHSQPLYGSSTLAYYTAAYWILIATALLLTTIPDLLGRCDLYPPLTIWERFRWDIVEMALAILLLTKSLVATDPLGILTPLGWWALFAFTTHWMFAHFFKPHPSTAAAIEFSLGFLALVYWVFFRERVKAMLAKPEAAPPEGGGPAK